MTYDTTYFTYNYLLPGTVADNISQTVGKFAKSKGISYDLWYRDLPVWIVRGKTGNRVNRVQIDAVLTPRHPEGIIAFTPDAY